MDWTTFSDLMTPAIVMWVIISDHGNINERNPEPVVETTHQFVVDLGDVSADPGPLRADNCWPLRSTILALLMELELLRQKGGVATFVSENQSAQEMREFVEKIFADFVCLTCTVAECVAFATVADPRSQERLATARIDCGRGRTDRVLVRVSICGVLAGVQESMRSASRCPAAGNWAFTR